MPRISRIPLPLAGIGSRTGTLAATDPIDTAALAGKVKVQGTLSATDSLDIAAFAGGVKVQGTLAATEGAADTAAFAGGVKVQGTLTATETTIDTAAFTGTVTAGSITGTLAATDSPDTAALSGTVSGGAVIEPERTGSGGGIWIRADKEVRRPVHGELHASERPDRASIKGHLVKFTRGTIRASENPDAARFMGRVRWTNMRLEAAHVTAMSEPDYMTARKIGETAIANYIKSRNRLIVKLAS